MLRTLPLLVLALALAACGDCDCCKKKAAPPTTAAAAPEAGSEAGDAEGTPPAVAAAWRGEGTTLELSVWHMRCAGCEKKVEDALKSLDGVSDVTASAKDSRVVVTLAKADAREDLKPRIRSTLASHDFRILGE